jgi:23S rRNA (pseudouridine1915-N3)-methyltransferase
VFRRANECLSFEPITLPHTLARVVLLEQLYRGVKIGRGERYHWEPVSWSGCGKKKLRC